ncbi:DUF7919 family protein [[Kitasatospora] papulosa]|uniref:DUF7919 family protein n=1 Tax=[Kitasatospora] papulosa TaxID=1464011 RepID=UPI0036ECE91B
MTYYPDLTAYEYDASGQEMLNVGWLTPGHAYRTGIVDDRVTDALKALSSAYDNQMRGVHHCEFCSTERPVILGGPALDTQVWLGSAEIRARGADGTVYSAPNLVIHYITEHRYCPPVEFCRAVVRTAGADTTDELVVSDD